MEYTKTKENNSSRNEENISVGDRVALIFNNSYKYGWVKWLGRRNHNSGLRMMAGVEFDKSFDHESQILAGLKGNEFFEALPNHGYYVLASTLIRNQKPETNHSNYAKSNSLKKYYMGESPLGNDMGSLSPFHQMAFEQLSGRNGAVNKVTNNILTHSNFSREKENLDFPHMSFGSHQNNNHKEILDDLKTQPCIRPKIKNCNRNLSSLLDDPCCSNGISRHEFNKFDYKNDLQNEMPRPTTLPRQAAIGVGVGGVIGGRDEPDVEPSRPPVSSPQPPESVHHPIYRYSFNGVNQLELLTDEEKGVLASPASGVPSKADLGIGSLVEVLMKDDANDSSPKPSFGVVRWVGTVAGEENNKERWAVGIEMEDLDDGLSDGTFKGQRLFSCAVGKALFVEARACAKDRRFLEPLSGQCSSRSSLAFGSLDCQPVLGSVRPPSSSEEVAAMFGRNKGIQGHQNSCYLDATLFSMFAFTSVFDSLLFRPPCANDIAEYTAVQTVLREEVVNPLRKNTFVRADRIMRLRTMLDHLSSVTGLTTEEKDPEEFLQSLLAQILRASPFLQLSSGQTAYHYQLFVDKDDKLNLPSVQTLFDQSFLASDIKLKQIPSCLIIQMPRFGKDYKMYPRILPSMVLDVTDVIGDSPRQCIICGKLAEFECKQCFGHCGTGLESISFCQKCMDKVHSHKKRGSHGQMRRLKVPPDFEMLAAHCGSIPRIYMELFAVVCIETSHYVAFTRCGSGADATWCFFDSMADRKGEQHGYNIPTVVECGDLMQWVGDEGSQALHTLTDNKSLPDLPRRLLCDAYMCFYQSPKVMMYR